MANPRAQLRYKITLAGGSTFQFDADGEWAWDDYERVYKDASDPPELESIRQAWEIRGTVLSTDGTPATAWSAFDTLRTAMNARGTGAPTKIELLLVDVDGTSTVKATLGPPDWDQFMVEEFRSEVDRDNPSATHLTAIPVFLRATARRVVEGSGGLAGVVGFEQTIEHAFDAGLETVTWVTLVTTEEGTDAVAAGKTLGLIPISSYGSSYSFLTNGDDGVAWEELDPDTSESPDRTVTRVRVTCQIKEWGVTVGVTDPGASPDEYSLLERIEEKDDERIRTVRASARGPGSQEWGQRQRPSGSPTDSVEEYDSARREFVGEWSFRTVSPKAEYLTRIVATLTGGHASLSWEPIAGGFRPVRFDGAVQPFKCVVAIQVTKRGGSGLLTELPLPPLLPGPWVLDYDESEEGAPVQEEAAAKDTPAKWVRDVRLTFWSPEPPSRHPITVYQANAGNAIPTYWI